MKHYNKRGEEIGTLEWANLMEDPDYKILKQEELSNGKFISTVWLGLDHNYSGNEILIFETMVFPEKDNWSEEYCERYSTEEEAIKGHKRIVKQFLKEE